MSSSIPVAVADRALASSPALAAEEIGLEQVVGGLRRKRERWRLACQRHPSAGGRLFPSRAAVREITEALTAALFPMRLGPDDLRQEHEDAFVAATLLRALEKLRAQVLLDIGHAAPPADDAPQRATAIVRDFAQSLPAIRSLLDNDVEAAYYGDPAARSVDEVLLSYPGVFAVIHYRLAHRLYELGAPLVAQLVSAIAHAETGIDIHPGASIGRSFFIDHGAGVVIGETAIIGDRVRLYQGVTLGGSFAGSSWSGGSRDAGAGRGQPRHPVVEDDVVIHAGATILGRIVIGYGSVIGGNVWLTHKVAPGSVVTQAGLCSDSGFPPLA